VLLKPPRKGPSTPLSTYNKFEIGKIQKDREINKIYRGKKKERKKERKKKKKKERKKETLNITVLMI
jgi:hypothetical protein